MPMPVAPDGDGSEVIPFTGSDALATRKAVTSARVELTRRAGELKRAQEHTRKELDRKRAEMEAEFARQRDELEALAAPLKAQLAKLTEVMWSVDLYLGRDESLRLIRDGEPAPADTPISLRQRVLVMAEESLVMMGHRRTGMTAEDIPEFIDWLLADEANLSRVLPEPKGVVVLIPTKVKTRSGNMFEDISRDAANERSWWLLRNGQRLYLLTVDPELRIHERVLPRRDEFVEVFDQSLFGYGHLGGAPVRPGSDQWMRLEAVADARRRHYMRVLMVLEGIIDRTLVWHPLPEGGASFLRLEDQDTGRIVLIQDDDDALQLTDGRESFQRWQKRLNAQLRPGLRVVGNWGDRDFRELYVEGDRFSRGYHPRIHPGNAEHPGGGPHLIEDRRDGGLVIRYQRTDKIEKRNVPVPDKPGYMYPWSLVEPAHRASCLIRADDSWVLPFDLASVADLSYYLNSRDNRSAHFLSMVPVIQSALEAKKHEASQEAAFRELLSRMLIGEGERPDTATPVVENLVHRWKLANTFSRALNGDPAHELKAAAEIVAQYRRQALHTDDESSAGIVRAGRAFPGAIAVVRDRQGRWFVHSPSVGAQDGGVFLDVTPIRKDATFGPRLGEVILTRRSVSALHVAWSNETWESWNFGANRNHYLSVDQRESMVCDLREKAVGTPLCVTEFFDPTRPSERLMAVYSWAAGTPQERPVVADPDPLSWRHRGSANPVTACVTRGVKNSDGVHLQLCRFGKEIPSTFSHYSGGSRWGNTPWWPESAPDYGDVRPRLVWADEGMLDQVKAWADQCGAQFQAGRARDAEAERQAYRYSRPVEAIIRARVEAAAYARFREDFADADDLWPAHLKSLQLRDAIHPRDLWGLVAIALKNDHPVVGQSLSELSDFAWECKNVAPGEWHPGSGRVETGEYGDILVPEPEN